MSRTRELLEDMAAADVPAPRAAFMADLETRLAELMRDSAAGDVLPDVELAPPAPPSQNVRARLAMSVGAAALCAALLVGTVLAGPNRVPDELRAAAARDTYVDDAGLGIDGGSDGTAAADQERTDEARPAAGATGGHRAVVKPIAPVEATPTPQPYEPGAQAAATATEERTRPATTTEPVAAKPVETLGLRVEGTAARVSLDWDRYDGPGFAAYLVLRANDADVPEYPDQSGRTLVLLRIENRDMVRHQDTPKVGTTPRYRIVVVDVDGRELARSAALSPANPLEASARLAAIAD